MEKADVIIIGGGIVGLSTAYNILEKYPEKKLLILEKEASLASHQTGRNSGVIHSGIYYKPGSLKAVNCRTGKKLLEEFCLKENIPFEICGKLIVAVEQSELEMLETLYQRGKDNAIDCRIISPEEIREKEPYTNGIKAIYVSDAGIVDYSQVAEKLGEIIISKGSLIKLNEKVVRIERNKNELVICTENNEFSSNFLVNCGGLYCDRIAEMNGFFPDLKIIPFRGEYYKLKPEAEYLCKNLIYPVPDPAFPFLGVHFTRMIKGGIECGPNAVLAFAREGYKKTDFNIDDFFETMNFPGMEKLISRHWKTGLQELWRSFSKKAFCKALSRLIPDIREEFLVPYKAGIRAQAVREDGTMADDFYIAEDNRVVNVLNAPSPAATASLNIGSIIASKLFQITK